MIVKNQFVFIKGFFHREDETLHFISSQNHTNSKKKRTKREKG